MYNQRTTINQAAVANRGSNFVNSNYWSSTEKSLADAINKNFEIGTNNISGKENTWRVRAIRAF
jgi:hypothetical protein